VWSVLVSSLSPLLALLAQDAGVRPSFLPTPTAIAQEPRYRLKPRRDGGYDYDDTRFKAVITPDGRVSFDEHRIANNRWYLIPVLPQNHPPGTQTLEGALKELLRRQPVSRSQPEPSMPERPRAAGPLTEADRRRMEEYGHFVPVVTTTGNADLTDEYYRMLGEDPYRQEKARFLSSTYDMRLKMAAESQVRDMRLALHDLPTRLDRLWKDPAQPPAAKRLMICMLWSELYRDDKGREATNVINHFVRTRLPRGSADGYSDAELQSCNARAEAGGKFDPYTPPPPRKPPPPPPRPAPAPAKKR
jgi:hypothetical protein